MYVLDLYGVQRILSMVAWFTYQKCFHVKYNLSNLFSIYHLPHTNFCIMKRNFVYSVCILTPTILIILEGNMSLPVKSGFIQEWAKCRSSSPSQTDHRNWLKKWPFWLCHMVAKYSHVIWLKSKQIHHFFWSWFWNSTFLCKTSDWCLWRML
jgi:hypothetical protein